MRSVADPVREIKDTVSVGLQMVLFFDRVPRQLTEMYLFPPRGS